MIKNKYNILNRFYFFINQLFLLIQSKINSLIFLGIPICTFPDDTFKYQGPPYGDLNCRQSDTNNPMGTINVTEYDNYPTMYGTCNVGNTVDGKPNDKIMTENQEATVSQRVDDLLFHKGNSQASFTPMPVDTLPNNQEAFANFCYRSPTNLLNPKYGSIFVNDPEKLKLIMKLTKPTGTENGGG